MKWWSQPPYGDRVVLTRRESEMGIPIALLFQNACENHMLYVDSIKNSCKSHML
jgi:hypothetical protein